MNGPTRGEMMNPENAQSGRPEYIDKTAEDAHPAVGLSQDVPAYDTQNVRYWEFR